MEVTKKEMLKAMRAKCMDCCCNQAKEVRLCPLTTCPLWKYRMGKDPDAKEPEMLAKSHGRE